jgi:hypothetical protein
MYIHTRETHACQILTVCCPCEPVGGEGQDKQLFRRALPLLFVEPRAYVLRCLRFGDDGVVYVDAEIRVHLYHKNLYA